MQNIRTFTHGSRERKSVQSLWKTVSRTETLGSGIWSHRSGLFLLFTSLGLCALRTTLYEDWAHASRKQMVLLGRVL